MNDSDNVSFSQLGQDLWVIETLDYKNKGFFIDIGAADGVKHSNTNLLEKNINGVVYVLRQILL